MRKWVRTLLLLSVLLLPVLVTCKKPAEEKTASLKDVEFSVPGSVSLEQNQPTMDFRVQFQKAPLVSDVIVLSGGGSKQNCAILETSTTKFTIDISRLWGGFLADGPYSVAIKRGSEEVTKGPNLPLISG